MKKILWMPLMLCCLYATAQTKTKKAKHKATVQTRHTESYRSKNGKMTARTLGKYDRADSVKAFAKEAEHINSNYNESMPPLSPNSGSSSPR